MSVSAAAAINASPATILIVDDEPANRKLMEAMLRRDNYQTIHAADGESALAAIALNTPDLILLDIKMPGMDGYQVARALKGDPGTSNIPIIVVTVLVDRDARLAALKAGVEELVTKPIDPGELLLRVRNLLRLKSLSDLFRNHGALLEQQVKARTADIGRFSAAMDSTADALYLVDRGSMRFLHVNDAACRMHGRTRKELLAKGPEIVLETPRPELELTYDAVIAGTGAPPLELPHTRKDGSQAWVEIRRHAHRAGDRWLIVTLVRDITDRKEAGDRIRRLNQVHAVLSGITTLIAHVLARVRDVSSGIDSSIARARGRDELAREICRIAVEQGKFRMAWVGAVDRQAGVVRPLSFAGEVRDFFDCAPLATSASVPQAYGSVGRAVQELKPVISNDILLDPPSPIRAKLQELRIASLAVIPLVVRSESIGVLALYAADAGFFDDEEMRLLQELTSNVSFAMDHIAS